MLVYSLTLVHGTDDLSNSVLCGHRLNIIGLTFFIASFLTVVVLTVDRFLAVQLHLRYQELVTRKRANAAAISIWVLSVILPLFCLLSSLAKGLINIVVGLCFIITAVANCRVYFAVRNSSVTNASSWK